MGGPGWLPELERLAAEENFSSVLALATEALASASDQRSEALARYYGGQARIRMAMPKRGRAEVLMARAIFERIGDDRMAVECLDWEATALHLGEDRRALPVAQEALRRCRLQCPNAHALHGRIQGHLGAIHIARHDWVNAIRSYEAAESATSGVRDLGRLLRMYNDLCVAHLELGDTRRSVEYGERALAIQSVVRDPASRARLENNLGLALLRHGSLDVAEERLARSLQLCRELGLDVGRAHVLLSVAELHAGRGDLRRSEEVAGEAADLAERLDERMTLAAAMHLMGRIRDGRGDRQGSDCAFARALELLSEAGARERLAECHACYAQVLEDRGDIDAALGHWQQAIGAVRHRGGPT